MRNTDNVTLHLLAEEVPYYAVLDTNEQIQVVKSKNIDVDPTLPLDEVATMTFSREAASLSQQVFGYTFYLSRENCRPSMRSDLIRVDMVESANGLVQFHPYSNSGITAEMLGRSYSSGYTGGKPDQIFASPIFKPRGGFGTLFDVMDGLAWLGVGWIIERGVASTKQLLTGKQLTRRARNLAQDFSTRAIYSVESIRRWADTRETWQTADAAKKLGVDHDTMESIFEALGYKKRYADQSWRLGETDAYRKLREEWIEGEPYRLKIERSDDPFTDW